ncbi:type II toxin-antitoxin system VapC family toxin [Acidiferrimicrobium sp. IK]|uniref:type II toxin-antitoxin system VapC family toxin n=1 Tax=Acidiferrimicrobium sp. IK TaxID=2871700 RepID=UPI0021CB4D82|nr:type II toxin-antitoxin system VapC family toxin [Acidiferrimicrobium sp. IK]MCU4185617.1 type II toxin-antitoxin system VapC family toxin [Acidiferrimicrobium sp. IK]
MSGRVVCDASALAALLMDAGPDGTWVTAALSGMDLAAPSLVGSETANVVRRHELAGLIGADQAAQVHADLLDLTVEHWPYELVAARAWQLRHNLSVYDAAYVALAELLETSLVTLDRRIAAAPGLRCRVSTP